MTFAEHFSWWWTPWFFASLGESVSPHLRTGFITGYTAHAWQRCSSLCLLLSPPLPYLAADEKSIESLPLFFSVWWLLFFQDFPSVCFWQFVFDTPGDRLLFGLVVWFIFADTFSMFLMISRVSAQPPRHQMFTPLLPFHCFGLNQVPLLLLPCSSLFTFCCVLSTALQFAGSS